MPKAEVALEQAMEQAALYREIARPEKENAELRTTPGQIRLTCNQDSPLEAYKPMTLGGSITISFARGQWNTERIRRIKQALRTAHFQVKG